jgi:hypothetical protein
VLVNNYLLLILLLIVNILTQKAIRPKLLNAVFNCNTMSGLWNFVSLTPEFNFTVEYVIRYIFQSCKQFITKQNNYLQNIVSFTIGFFTNIFFTLCFV